MRENMFQYIAAYFARS